MLLKRMKEKKHIQVATFLPYIYIYKEDALHKVFLFCFSCSIEINTQHKEYKK